MMLLSSLKKKSCSLAAPIYPVDTIRTEGTEGKKPGPHYISVTYTLHDCLSISTLSATMTDAEIVQHYNLPSAYPEEWPAELDESDSDDGGAQPRKPPQQQRDRKSRYFALERSASRRGSYFESHKREEDHENPIKRDESDPLGLGDRVIRTLKKRGLPVDEDLRLRNRFLLSSTSFSPAYFLARVHSDASIRSLLQGLEFLSQSIDQKSASLKVLVEANFERFVRAKATIDSVYNEMRNQGADEEESSSAVSANRTAAGRRGRYSTAAVSVSSGPVQDRRKNALTKEGEYGMRGIRTPLVEASIKAEELWGPALGGREREHVLRSVINALKMHRDIYDLGSSLSKSIKQREYDYVFDQYTRARVMANRARDIAADAASSGRALTDDETHTILATGRMWMAVDQQIQMFKHDLWRRLTNPLTSAASYTDPIDEHMELIGALLQLGVEDNPIWVWLRNRYEALKKKITTFTERSKVEIEILRRRLVAGEKPSPRTVASYLRQALREGVADLHEAIDADQVIELWECIHTYLERLLSMQGGLLGEVADLWEVTQSFLDGRRQKLLPVGFEGESRRHHWLSPEGMSQLRDVQLSLIDLIRKSVLSLFNDAPIDDISMLMSPTAPASPNSPLGSGITPTESRFKLDPTDMPSLAPKRGEPWEDYAFWPPYSNCLSGVRYLSKFLFIIGTAAGEMSTLDPTSNNVGTQDLLKALVSTVRDRSVCLSCAVWGKDAEQCKLFEDWTRDVERRDMTRMPGTFVSFENTILGEMQKMLYISEAMARPDAAEIITHPPVKLLQMVRAQFVSSVYKALSGLVENAEHPSQNLGDSEWVTVKPTAAANAPDAALSVLAANAVDADNRVRIMRLDTFDCQLTISVYQNVRVLLTLSNLRALQEDLVPQLIANFETLFSVTLTEEAKTISDVLGQIDDRLFQSYTEPVIDALNRTIYKGVTSPEWVPTNEPPRNIRPYVYSTLLTLVLVHTEISTTVPPMSSAHFPQTASSLLTTILTYLVTQVFSSLLPAFSARSRYTLGALVQATLDTEFIGQIMSLYTSDEASAIQSRIYVELDRRTTNEARARLQVELGEMRSILKTLRERTKGEFACFKKPRSGTGPKAI